MHEAFELVSLFPHQTNFVVELISSFDDCLLIANKTGHLIVGRLSNNGPTKRAEFHIEKVIKSFGRNGKVVQQLLPFVEHDVLFSLSDSMLVTHELTRFSPIGSGSDSRLKGCTLFCGRSFPSQSGQPDSLKLALCIKRRIQLFEWRNVELKEIPGKEFSVPDPPKAMEFFHYPYLCVGNRRSYHVINLDTGDTLADIFTPGRNMEPSIVRMQDNHLALARDAEYRYLQFNADEQHDAERIKINPVKEKQFSFSEAPHGVVHKHPYVVGLLPKSCEVWCTSPKTRVQTMDAAGSKQIVQSNKGQIFVAGPTMIWTLAPVSTVTQIRQLIQLKEFKLALSLIEGEEAQSTCSDEIRALAIEIKTRYAVEQFCSKRFEEAFDIFTELGENIKPIEVIYLFPQLHSVETRRAIQFESLPKNLVKNLPELTGSELERGLMHLAKYLVGKRNELILSVEAASQRLADLKKSEMAVDEDVLKREREQVDSLKYTHIVFDTILLKCYVFTNESLIESFLRLKDNCSHLEESEKILIKHVRYHELLLLYERRGLHDKALNMLRTGADDAAFPLLAKVDTLMMEYLRRLGPEHMSLIFEYASWLFARDPELTMKLFTGDSDLVIKLPKEKIIDFLKRNCPARVLDYIEYLVIECGDTKVELHNLLGQSYIERLKELMGEFLKKRQLEKNMTVREDASVEPVRPGQESGDLGLMRSKFIEFLRTSTHYQPDTLLRQMPLDVLLEERCILLARLGQHELALGIYLYILLDVDGALAYCEDAAAMDVERGRGGDVFYTLIRLLFDRTGPSRLALPTSAVVTDTDTAPFADRVVDITLEILAKHSDMVDLLKVLDVLPDSVSLQHVGPALESALLRLATAKRRDRMLKNLLQAEHLRFEEKRIAVERTRFVIKDDKVCAECKNRLKNSAFARHPNGSIVHLYCLRSNSMSLS